MQLTWVNHASFLLDCGDVRLLCDPWIEGSVFNNGWRLASPTKLRYDDFAGVTHIWFSHEHPDHFFPPNLRNIPEAIRREIIVLFHETRDKRVVNVCRSLGFAVQELPEQQRVWIAADFSVLCGVNEDIDSWIAITAEGKTILNLNDCIFATKDELLAIRKTIGDVDLLLSQFSYANWVGNPDDLVSHRAHAVRKRTQMTAQIEAIRPRQFIPFASYVWFCHEENFHMNASANRIGDIYRFLTDELHQDTVVLYPGDEWQVGSPYSSQGAIGKYESDFQNALSCRPVTSETISLERLQEAMSELSARCNEKNNAFLLRALGSAVARVTDIGQDVDISFGAEIRPVHGREPDIILSSDSLMYCIKTDWGGETLKINGRFQVPPDGNPERFFRLFRVPQHNGYGSHLNLRFAAGRMIDVVLRRAAN
jgi:UDP-MurNAc hydroxylase